MAKSRPVNVIASARGPVDEPAGKPLGERAGKGGLEARTERAWYHELVRMRAREWDRSMAIGALLVAACACSAQQAVPARSSALPARSSALPMAQLATRAEPPPAALPGAGSAAAAVPGLRSGVELEAASPARAEPGTPPVPVPGAHPRPASERGWLGVELAQRGPNEPGVLVRDVVRGSPAAGSGLTTGDVILSVDGENVARPEDVSRLVAVRGAGQRLRLGLLRSQATRLLAIELERFPDSTEIMRRQYVGLQAPELDALETAQGSLEPRLAPLHGKVVVLEFWASWCGPCHVLSPVLQGWHERFTPQGVVVMGVAAETLPVVSRAAFQMGIAYPLFADPSGATTKAYRAMALPTVFVLDKGGRVRDVMVGYSSPALARLENLVKRLIDES